MAGITPARAGKTFISVINPVVLEDHPRSRGKDAVMLTRWRFLLGSPPLARERPVRVNLSARRLGITPARAGKTSPARPCSLVDGDHPRSRGKDASASRRGSPGPGSPPLARERQLDRLCGNDHPGITPARAGKTR